MSDEALPAPDDGPALAGRSVVEAVGITKRYGSTLALSGADITVQSGSTHALVGRNGAGKSTLVAILTGLQAPDSGTVTFAGQPAPRLRDRDGWRRQVACVYQKSTIIPTLTVAENLYLNRHAAGRAGLINWAALRRDARRLLAAWSVDVDVNQPAATLTVEQRQLVEIARALSFGARFIILDEPTAQLDGAAIDRLFERIRALQAQGVTFLFISHHLQEIYEICDTVTVLRDARRILTAPVAAVSREQLVAAMTGENVAPGRGHRPAPAAGGRPGRSGRTRTGRGRRAWTNLTSPSGPVKSWGWPGPAAAARSRWPNPWWDCASRYAARCTSLAGGCRREASRRHSPPAWVSCHRTGTGKASCRCCPSRRTSP